MNSFANLRTANFAKQLRYPAPKMCPRCLWQLHRTTGPSAHWLGTRAASQKRKTRADKHMRDELKQLQQMITRLENDTRDQKLSKFAEDQYRRLSPEQYEQQFAELLQPAAEQVPEKQPPKLPQSIHQRLLELGPDQPGQVTGEKDLLQPQDPAGADLSVAYDPRYLDVEWKPLLRSLESHTGFVGLPRKEIDLFLLYIPNSQRPELADTFLSMMKQANVPVSRLTVDLLMDGYAETGQLEKAVDCFQMVRANVDAPSIYTYGHLLKALSNSSEDEFSNCLAKRTFPESVQSKTSAALQVLAEMRTKNIQLNTLVLTTIIDICLHDRAIGEAQDVFALMKLQGAKTAPDLRTYNLMIFGCAHTADAERAFDLLEEMRTRSQPGPLTPNQVTVAALVQVCCTRPRDYYYQGWSTARSLAEQGIQPNSEITAGLLELCANAGDLPRAKHVFRSILARSKQPREQHPAEQWQIDGRVLEYMLRAFSKSPMARRAPKNGFDEFSAFQKDHLRPKLSSLVDFQRLPREGQGFTIDESEIGRIETPFRHNHVDHRSHVLEDLDNFVKWIHKEYPGLITPPLVSSILAVYSRIVTIGKNVPFEVYNERLQRYFNVVTMDLAHENALKTNLGIFEDAFWAVYACARQPEVLSTYAALYWSFFMGQPMIRQMLANLEQPKSRRQKQLLSQFKNIARLYISAFARADDLESARAILFQFCDISVFNQAPIESHAAETVQYPLQWSKLDLKVLHTKAAQLDDQHTLEILRKIYETGSTGVKSFTERAQGQA